MTLLRDRVTGKRGIKRKTKTEINVAASVDAPIGYGRRTTVTLAIDDGKVGFSFPLPTRALDRILWVGSGGSTVDGMIRDAARDYVAAKHRQTTGDDKARPDYHLGALYTAIKCARLVAHKGNDEIGRHEDDQQIAEAAVTVAERKRLIQRMPPPVEFP